MSFYEVTKRMRDIILASFGLVLFSIPMLLTAIWIKLVSPKGPVFADIPLRMGKDGKGFRLFKFRSMIPDAHNYLINDKELYKKYVENDYKLSMKEDPRIIKGGAFIRKYSVDELPQFINVLLGTMSMVGYRAYYFYEVDEQKKRYPECAQYLEKALTVKPGITGTWQVSGRSEVSFLNRIKMDAGYADKRSLLYDLLVILKTPFAVLSSKGAY